MHLVCIGNDIMICQICTVIENTLLMAKLYYWYSGSLSTQVVDDFDI